ncbi:hypothetical protein DFH06DRAFT_1300266 [Mycena polygramma]|nr:hypothetical protein DFH06DRAFT_1300266 [Mycena polygramma]
MSFQWKALRPYRIQSYLDIFKIKFGVSYFSPALDKPGLLAAAGTTCVFFAVDANSEFEERLPLEQLVEILPDSSGPAPCCATARVERGRSESGESLLTSFSLHTRAQIRVEWILLYGGNGSSKTSSMQLCLHDGAPPTTIASLLEPSPAPRLDLAHLITSNEPPLESEVPLVHSIISDKLNRLGPLNTQIRDLQAQIRDLQSTLAQVIQRRDETAESVRLHQSIVSPIRRLPPDVICELLALTWERKDMLNGPPWYLGQICRLWRNCALSYASLWTSIVVPSFLTSHNGHLLASIEAQLLRSADVSLDLHWPSVQNAVDPRLLELVFGHCRRWRSLHFHDAAHHRDRVLDWLHPVNGHLDQLEKLEVIGSYRMFVPDVFSTAPNLRQVVLAHASSSSCSPESIRIPWGQITHYRGTYQAARQLAILRSAPNLEDCVLGFADRNFEPEVALVELPYLRRLSSECVLLLDYLTAPVLEDLRLTLGPDNLTSLLPFVHRSLCTLTRLSLLDCHINAHIMSVLYDVPGLTYLLLEYAHDQHDVRWIGDMFIPDVCPELTSLVVGFRPCSFDMVRARFRPNPRRSEARLGYLRIFDTQSFGDALPESVGAQIERLRDEGLDAGLVDWQGGVELKKSFLS